MTTKQTFNSSYALCSLRQLLPKLVCRVLKLLASIFKWVAQPRSCLP